MIARTRGQHAEALALYAASIGFFRDLGELWSVANCLEGIAEALGGLGRAEAAARLFGAAAALRRTIGAPMLPADCADYERAVAAVRRAGRRCLRRGLGDRRRARRHGSGGGSDERSGGGPRCPQPERPTRAIRGEAARADPA